MIRAVEARDRENWERLFLAYGVFYETDFTPEILERVWALLLEPGSGIDAFVVQHDDVVVGFAHYRSHPDTFSGGRDWFLDDLYVDPDARGAGHASALIAHLADVARSSHPAGSVRWITAADNTRAQRVYDRLATRTSWVTYELKL